MWSEEAVMPRSRATFVLILLVVAQVLCSMLFTHIDAVAQSDQLVAVVVGEKSQDACEVRYRRSTDGDNWVAQSLTGPAEACQGGLVTAYIVTQSEASGEVARATDAPSTESVSLVSLTGDPDADEVAILDTMNSVHEILDPEVVAEEDPLGYMSPETLKTLPLVDEAPAASVLAANCRTGNVGQQRRADVKFKSYNVGAVVQAYVYYKRISCARWKITDVKMTLIQPPTRDRGYVRRVL
jgi:hypothetical protein